jgi:GNAT superfamily N-acetyltransferase
VSSTEARWMRGEYELTDDRQRVDLDTVHRLLSTTYWAESRTREQVAATIAASTCFSLLHRGAQVGFFRGLTDTGAYTYLMDFVIEPSHRRGGIGSWALEQILAYPAFAGTRMILITKDAQPFYRRAGFVPHPYECMIRRP